MLPDTGRRLPSNQKKEGIAMVTYDGLFQFGLLIVAIVSLVYQITLSGHFL